MSDATKGGTGCLPASQSRTSVGQTPSLWASRACPQARRRNSRFSCAAVKSPPIVGQLLPCGPLKYSLLEPLLRRLQRMPAPLVELILQSQAFLVSFDRAYRLHEPVDPCPRLELAELARRRGAFARIVIRETRVPPDAGVQAFRELQARVIGTGFLRRSVQVHKVRPGDHAHGRFAFPSMHVRCRVRFMF